MVVFTPQTPTPLVNKTPIATMVAKTKSEAMMKAIHHSFPAERCRMGFEIAAVTAL